MGGLDPSTSAAEERLPTTPCRGLVTEHGGDAEQSPYPTGVTTPYYTPVQAFPYKYVNLFIQIKPLEWNTLFLVIFVNVESSRCSPSLMECSLVC